MTDVCCIVTDVDGITTNASHFPDLTPYLSKVPCICLYLIVPPATFLSIMPYLSFLTCPLLSCVRPMHALAMQSSVCLHSSFCIHFMSPVLLCKSNTYVGNAEQCMLAFTHQLHQLLLYHLIPLYVLFVNA